MSKLTSKEPVHMTSKEPVQALSSNVLAEVTKFYDNKKPQNTEEEYRPRQIKKFFDTIGSVIKPEENKVSAFIAEENMEPAMDSKSSDGYYDLYIREGNNNSKSYPNLNNYNSEDSSMNKSTSSKKFGFHLDFTKLANMLQINKPVVKTAAMHPSQEKALHVPPQLIKFPTQTGNSSSFVLPHKISKKKEI
jgi:hypothetical protein